MALVFPSNPSVNDTYQVNGRTYVWNGTSWRTVKGGVPDVVPTLDVDNDFSAGGVLHVDSTNNEVGIGTAAPSHQLHLTQDLGVDGNLIVGGTITVPTPTAGTNDTTAATTAFVQTAVAGIVDSAPTTLDTLNELAAALGDDANFATTVTNSLAGKSDTGHVHSYLPLSGGTVTGLLTASGGIDGLTLANGISGSNFNITGVNQMEIADPGEGIIWKGGASGDYSMYLIDDSSDKVLHVGGVTNSRVRITASSGNAEIELDYQNNGSQRWSMYANSSDHSINWYTSQGAGTKMQLTSSGSLGVNKTSPSYTLDVNGNGRFTTNMDVEGTPNDKIRLRSTATSTRPYMSFWNWNGTDYVRRGYVGYPGSGGTTADIYVTADNGKVRINPSLQINGGPLLTDVGTANELRVTTAHGYIDIGPKNTSYCHIYTDRNAFYFNKQTQHEGGIFMRGTLDMDNEIIDMTHSSSYISFGDVDSVNMQWGAGGDIRWNPTYNYITVNQGSSQRMVWACNNGYSYAQRFYQPGGGSTYDWSDARLKKDVTDYSDGLELILQLRPVEYTWDCDQIPANGQREIGLIAQEVEAVYPKWVGKYSEEPHTRTSDGAEVTDVKALGFGNDFNVIVIAAIKELVERIEALEAV